MPFVLALVSAVFYGAADFMGGIAARGAATIAVVTVAQLAGLVLLGLFLPLLPPAAPTVADMAWGVAAGLAGSTGVALLYHGLAIGTMSLVAPTTAVCAVAVPVIVDVALGARLSPRTTAGILLALVAIVVVSQDGGSSVPAGGKRRRALPPGIGIALLSGVAIGLFLLMLAQTSANAGLWPLLPARTVSVAVFAALLLARGDRRLPSRPAAIAVIGGALDMIANAAYLLAVPGGELAAIVTLSSLYPAATVVLARLLLRERLGPQQAAGVVTALIAVVLIVG